MPDSPLPQLNNKKKQLLIDGCDFLNIKINEPQINQLIDYSVLLGRWNQTYNLTAIRDPLDVIRFHLLDSLAINQFLEGNNFIDVGTGAGLPGIPLAIINPHRKFTLLDSNGKKTRFLFQAKLDLGLANIDEINDRAAAVDWTKATLEDGESEDSIMVQLQSTGWSRAQSRAIIKISKK